MRRNHVLWCFTLLYVASSSKSQLENSSTTSNDERNNSTVRYEIHVNMTANNRNDDAEAVRYNALENLTKNNNDQFKFRANSTNDDYEDNDSVQNKYSTHKDHESGNQLTELRANFTKMDDESNSTSHKPREIFMQDDNRSNLTLYEDLGKFHQDNSEKIVIPYEMCENSTCILLCCPLGSRWVKEECIPSNANYPFPDVYKLTSNDSFKRAPIGKTLDQVFQLAIRDPCPIVGHYLLQPDKYPEDEHMFLVNGSLYLPHLNNLIESYCLGVLKDKYEIFVCFSSEPDEIEIENAYFIPWGLVISLPFLLTTFVVYSILPELRILHGSTLLGYVGSLCVAHIFLVAIQQIDPSIISTPVCIIFAFIIHFSFSANFFWLNVMCFDIWCKFRNFRSLQENTKQRNRKKCVMYSIYAWGSAIVLDIVCAIMDFVPSVPKELIRPEFGVTKCWFNTDKARVVYFYGPMGITVICNICLFISTTLKIMRQKKNIVHDLESSESRRHDNNKQWFNLYLKLCIVMGLYWYINWTMEIISWLYKTAPIYIWYLTDLTNALQSIIIFIIFVWKKEVKRLLLKRFGCQNRAQFCSPETKPATIATVQPHALALHVRNNVLAENQSLCSNKLPCEESIQ